jgi:hypothetical protein
MKYQILEYPVRSSTVIVDSEVNFKTVKVPDYEARRASTKECRNEPALSKFCQKF